MIQLTISGNPTPQKRTRHCKQGDFIRVYDPSSKDQDRIRKEIIKQLDSDEWPKDRPIFDQKTPIALNLNFRMPIPKSFSKSKRMALEVTSHISKPDLDNLAAIVLNAMSGIVYHDDRQIAILYLKKVYSDDPKTIITVFKCV